MTEGTKCSDSSYVVAEISSHEKKPASLKRQRILDEEKYVEALGEIIQRDFFPDLKGMTLKKEYLDAVENNDIEKIRQIELEYHREIRAQSEKSDFGIATPRVSENADSISVEGKAYEENSVAKDGKKLDIHNETLDTFLSKTTSEDNASFEVIMEEARQKHREKFAWLFDKENEQKMRQESVLALSGPGSSDYQAIEGKPLNLETWTYKPKNSLMYVPEGVDFSAEELIEKSRKKGQEIIQKNTRFEDNPFDSVASKSLMLAAAKEHSVARRALGKVGVDGRVEHSDDSPKVNGYGFLATPSPAPGVDASPLMTWGEIEGTPMRLDATPYQGNSTPGPTFKIPDAPRREKLGHALAEKVSKQQREKRKKVISRAANAIGKSPNRFGIDRQGTLSPAAQNLLKSSIRISSDSALRSSYSPSPGLRTPGSATPSSRTTPKSTSTLTPRPSHAEATASLTDNLLQLPNT